MWNNIHEKGGEKIKKFSASGQRKQTSGFFLAFQSFNNIEKKLSKDIISD